MADHSFNPNDVAVSNGNIFGFPVHEKEAELFIVPIPFDATASFGKGTAEAPEGILEYSTQLDFYHHTVSKPWEQKIFWKPLELDIQSQNSLFSEEVKTYIQSLENGEEADSNIVNQVNAFQKQIQTQLKTFTLNSLKTDKIVGVLGGEHSVPLGLIEGLSEFYNEKIGVLQFDAHCDLRIAYEGFYQSHASIMNNVLQNKNVRRLVQVGIRDASPSEMKFAISDARISCFTDFYLHNQLFNGKKWSELAKEIVSHLPDLVYISFDIDGLSPENCPQTGTPVPGGLTYNQAIYLLWEINRQNKRIIGFDLCEVGTSDNNYDENIGARILYELSCLALHTKSKA